MLAALRDRNRKTSSLHHVSHSQNQLQINVSSVQFLFMAVNELEIVHNATAVWVVTESVTTAWPSRNCHGGHGHSH